MNRPAAKSSRRSSGEPPRRAAVFVDRDGTIIRDVGYLRSVDQIQVVPGAIEALRRLRAAGFLLVAVSNQSGVARGYFTEQDVQRANETLQGLLRSGGAELDAIHYCPYLPEGIVPEYARVSELRKPAPGMLLQAARELGIDLARSWMVGDSSADVEAGRRAGCRTIRLAAQPDQPQADFVAADLAEAADLILSASHR